MKKKNSISYPAFEIFFHRSKTLMDLFIDFIANALSVTTLA
jgi:hypothetical protein